MVRRFSPVVAPLFVPATRPERFLKAAHSGADAIIIDLEDAVAAAEKEEARARLAAFDLATLPVPVYVRTNASNTQWFVDDLDAIARMAVAGIVLPKTETEDDLRDVAERSGEALPVIGLIETAVGVNGLPQLGQASNLAQMAFGSIDFALDIGARHQRDSLLLTRSALVLHARAARLPAPLDGVTVAISDAGALAADCDHAAALGFGGKLAIHPGQIEAIRTAFRPSAEEVAWARKVLSAEADAAGAAVKLDGAMIDAPVAERARRILARVT
jgi:citrate lyase subunit beta/citryl-CoA lyase